MGPELGISFGNYTLLRRLARGGMAEVFIARHKSTQHEGATAPGRVVAIKRILPHLLDDISFVRMFQNEAELAARLSHPAIVDIYDFGKVEEHFYIAMEFIDGVHTGDLIVRAAQIPMPAALVARIGADASAGLHYAHQRRDDNGQPLQLVHRDVSPPNLLVSYDGKLKLLDFGIAKAVNTIEQTRSGVVKGKFAYMSPEQTMGQALDGRSDVFSLALVMWELLAGRGAVTRDDQILAMQTIRDGRVPAIESVRSDVPKALASALKSALQKSPDSRPNALEFSASLEKYLRRSSEPSSHADLGAWLQAAIPQTPIWDESGPIAGQPLANEANPPGQNPHIAGLDEGQRMVFAQPGALPTYQDFDERPRDTSGMLPQDDQAKDPLFGYSEERSVVVAADSNLPGAPADDNSVTRVMQHPLPFEERAEPERIAPVGPPPTGLLDDNMDTVIAQAPVLIEPGLIEPIPVPQQTRHDTPIVAVPRPQPAKVSADHAESLRQSHPAYQTVPPKLHQSRGQGNSRLLLVGFLLLLALAAIAAFAYQQGLFDEDAKTPISVPVVPYVSSEQASPKTEEPISAPVPPVPISAPVPMVESLPKDAGLQEKHGTLTITSSPKSSVYHGRRKLGSTPLENFSLRPGTYRLRLKAPRRKRVTRDVVIKAGETSTLDVRLPRRRR